MYEKGFHFLLKIQDLMHENSGIRTSRGSVRKRNKKTMDLEKNQATTTSSSLAAPELMTKNGTKKGKINGRDRGKRYPLLSYHELPDYMKDNEYILNYYRADWPIKEAFFSIFRWHNETLNVWTHLLGFFLFLGLTIANIAHVPEFAYFITMFTGQFQSSTDSNITKNFSQGQAKLIDMKQESNLKIDIPATHLDAANWPFYVFLCGSMFCLLSSSICHLFCCHSRHLNIQLLQLDYVGIAVMIITSFFPPIYYIFQCTPHWQIVYLTGISILGLCTVITLLAPSLSAPKYRPFRAMLFVSMGLFGLFPAIHSLAMDWNDPHRNTTLAYESVMALSYVLGTVFYVSRVPERWKPGWFDIAGHSHQIFHVFVVMGALAHYGGVLVILRYRGMKAC